MKTIEKQENRLSEVVALICAVLGWLSFGFIAVPGLIIAHIFSASSRREGKPKSPTNKATFIVGYISLMTTPAMIAVAMIFVRVRTSSLKANFEPVGLGGPVSSPRPDTSFNLDFIPEISNGASFWLIVISSIVLFVVLLPAIVRLSARMFIRHQEQTILKRNEVR